MTMWIPLLQQHVSYIDMLSGMPGGTAVAMILIGLALTMVVAVATRSAFVTIATGTLSMCVAIGLGFGNPILALVIFAGACATGFVFNRNRA